MGSKFKTDAEFGKRYKDRASGFEGQCTAVYFFEHGCERVNLRGINGQGEVVEYAFDSPDLSEVPNLPVEKPQAPQLVSQRPTGGPHGVATVSRR